MGKKMPRDRGMGKANSRHLKSLGPIRQRRHDRVRSSLGRQEMRRSKTRPQALDEQPGRLAGIERHAATPQLHDPTTRNLAHADVHTLSRLTGAMQPVKQTQIAAM